MWITLLARMPLRGKTLTAISLVAIGLGMVGLARAADAPTPTSWKLAIEPHDATVWQAPGGEVRFTVPGPAASVPGTLAPASAGVR